MAELSDGPEAEEPKDELEELREEARERYHEGEQPGEPKGGGQKETEGSQNESERPEPEGLDEFRRQVAAKYSGGDPP